MPDSEKTTPHARAAAEYILSTVLDVAAMPVDQARALEVYQEDMQKMFDAATAEQAALVAELERVLQEHRATNPDAWALHDARQDAALFKALREQEQTRHHSSRLALMQERAATAELREENERLKEELAIANAYPLTDAERTRLALAEKLATAVRNYSHGGGGWWSDIIARLAEFDAVKGASESS